MLIDLKPREWAKIVAIEGGQSVRQRLSLRGIQQGVIVKMISSMQGPVVLEVNRHTIVIGRGIAAKVLVQKLKEQKRSLGDEKEVV